MRGRFITLEGGEGTGKSSHARLLAHRLQSHGLDVVLTREPGGSPGAEIIRHIILSGAAQPFGPEAEAILFAAARNDHLNATIRPALQRGTWVICDRFADSTRVYQGRLGGVDPKLIRALERITIGRDQPELTIILDVPAKLGLERAAKRRGRAAADRYEAETIDFHSRLREAFLALAAEESDRCIVIDTDRPRHEVADKIWAVVQERLDPLGQLLSPRQAAL